MENHCNFVEYRYTQFRAILSDWVAGGPLRTPFVSPFRRLQLLWLVPLGWHVESRDRQTCSVPIGASAVFTLGRGSLR